MRSRRSSPRRPARRSVLALSSGTAALHLALVVHGIGAGDEVACSSLTFAASANADRLQRRPAVLRRLRRELADRPEPPRRGAHGARARRRPRPRGRSRSISTAGAATTTALAAVCARHEVALISGRCRVTRRDLPGATVGHAGATRGAVVQRQQDHHDERRRRARRRPTRRWSRTRASSSTQAREPVPHYEHTEIGFNYRLSNLLAAVGRAQLAVLPERVAARQRINARYRELLGDMPGIGFMPAPTDGTLELLAHVHHRRSGRVRRRPGADPARARGGGHRGAPGLEADAPTARLRGRPDLRRRRLRAPLRARALPAERLGDDATPTRTASSPRFWQRRA